MCPRKKVLGRARRSRVAQQGMCVRVYVVRDKDSDESEVFFWLVGLGLGLGWGWGLGVDQAPQPGSRRGSLSKWGFG